MAVVVVLTSAIGFLISYFYSSNDWQNAGFVVLTLISIVGCGLKQQNILRLLRWEILKKKFLYLDIKICVDIFDFICGWINHFGRSSFVSNSCNNIWGLVFIFNIFSIR